MAALTTFCVSALVLNFWLTRYHYPNICSKKNCGCDCNSEKCCSKNCCLEKTCCKCCNCENCQGE